MLGSQPDSQRLGLDCSTATILISASIGRADGPQHLRVEDRTQPNSDLFPAGSPPLATPSSTSSAKSAVTHPMEAAIGDLFRIKYPDDWQEEEIYDFDWTVLRNQKERFEKINFDAIPC
jgi:hypothetical protein